MALVRDVHCSEQPSHTRLGQEPAAQASAPKDIIRRLPRCWLCGTPLEVRLTLSRRGRRALGLACPIDGRHVRVFINDPSFIAEVLRAQPGSAVCLGPEQLRDGLEAALLRRERWANARSAPAGDLTGRHPP